ncbi:MAG: SDR family oxidoreductase [Ignavibacteriales bacterium]|nr:SDR family oxidoreductase [Ignavibacteriales bacterium]
MAMSLDKQCALVTGIGSGIGLETARRFAAMGARVVGVDRNEQKLKEAIRSLNPTGQPHVGLLKDLRLVDTARSVVPEALQVVGYLDIVVNAAGVCYFTKMEEISAEEFDEVMEVNVRALFFISVAAAESMKTPRGGHIINLGSNAGRKGRALSAHYAASKAAVKNITESLALAYGSRNVAVNTVCPGPTDTPMWEGNFRGLKAITGKDPKDFWETWKNQTPLGRIGTVADVANLICFLASEEGSFINGQEINVCGGFMLTS